MNQLELSYDSPVMTEDEQTIWRILERTLGRCNAIRSEDLEIRTGISKRSQRLIVNRLRNVFHKPIGSTFQQPAGYYLCQTPEEIDEFTNPIRKHAVQELYMISNIKRFSIDEILNQVKLDLTNPNNHVGVQNEI